MVSNVMHGSRCELGKKMVAKCEANPSTDPESSKTATAQTSLDLWSRTARQMFTITKDPVVSKSHSHSSSSIYSVVVSYAWVKTDRIADVQLSRVN
jgi:hypothetical protein